MRTERVDRYDRRCSRESPEYRAVPKIPSSCGGSIEVAVARLNERRSRSRASGAVWVAVGTEAITAIIAAILALANALDKKGALSFEEYRDALLSMYREMPHEDASGDAGHIFDGMLSQLQRAIRNRQKQT